MKRFIVLISLLAMFLISSAIAAGPPGVNHEVKLMPGIATSQQNQMDVIRVAINAITLPGQISLNVVIDNYNNMFVSNSVAKTVLTGRAGEGQIVNEFYFPDGLQHNSCAVRSEDVFTDYNAGDIFTARFGAVSQSDLLTTEVGLVRLWPNSNLNVDNGNLFVYNKIPAWAQIYLLNQAYLI